VCGAVRMMRGADALHIAGMLRNCADRVEAAGQHAGEGTVAQLLPAAEGVA